MELLYIFNDNEELLAVLRDDPVTIQGGTDHACAFVELYHREKLNGEDTLDFTVPAEHPDAEHIVEGNLVAFKDLDENWRLFEIRVCKDTHDDEGLARAAHCESSAYELIDEIIEDLRPTDDTAQFALTNALNGSRWEVGVVDDLGINSTTFYYISRLEAIHKMTTVWGGELKFRVSVQGGVIAHRYVDILTRRGADAGRTFRYGRDMLEIEREVDMSNLVTAVYGRGKGEQVETGGYGRRTTFATVEWTVAGGDPVDKPVGQEWVGDPNALAQWGRPGGRHRFGIFEDPEETDPAALLQKTWDALQKRKSPRVTYRLDAVDLERLSGYEHEKARLGDTVRVVDRKFSPELLIEARVIEIDRNLLQPEETKVILGNFSPTLADDALKQQRINQAVGDRQGVWDRATQFNLDGTLNTNWLTDTLVGLAHELQLADGAVTGVKIAINTIKTENLKDGAVTDMKLAAGSVKESKLNWQTHLLY